MSVPVVSFEQRNNFTRLELKLHPDYAEYYLAGEPGLAPGFLISSLMLCEKSLDDRKSLNNRR